MGQILFHAGRTLGMYPMEFAKVLRYFSDCLMAEALIQR